MDITFALIFTQKNVIKCVIPFNDMTLSNEKQRLQIYFTARNMILLQGNNKGTDQPAHPPHLISTFVIRYLESIVAKLATCKISLL